MGVMGSGKLPLDCLCNIGFGRIEQTPLALNASRRQRGGPIARNESQATHKLFAFWSQNFYEAETISLFRRIPS